MRITWEDAYYNDYFRTDPRPCPPGEIPIPEKDAHDFAIDLEKRNAYKKRKEDEKLKEKSDKYWERDYKKKFKALHQSRSKNDEPRRATGKRQGLANVSNQDYKRFKRGD